MRRMEELLARYRQKYLFAGFEIGFMAFAVIFLENCRFFASIGGIVAKMLAKTFIRRI